MRQDRPLLPNYFSYILWRNLSISFDMLEEGAFTKKKLTLLKKADVNVHTRNF